MTALQIFLVVWGVLTLLAYRGCLVDHFEEERLLTFGEAIGLFIFSMVSAPIIICLFYGDQVVSAVARLRARRSGRSHDLTSTVTKIARKTFWV